MIQMAMPGLPLSLDFEMVTPEGYEEARQAWDSTVAEKGGTGSGHYGHSGRPGKRGGSRPRWETYNVSGNTVVYHGTRKEFLDDIFKNGLGVGKEWMGRPPSVYFTVDKEEAIQWSETLGNSWDHAIVEFSIPDGLDSDIITDGIANRDFGWNTSFRIEHEIPTEYIRAVIIGKTRFVPSTAGDGVPYDMVREVVSERRKELTGYALVVLNLSDKSVLKGGPGSGHHGHSGRPGKVGGSTANSANYVGNVFTGAKLSGDVDQEHVSYVTKVIANVTKTVPSVADYGLRFSVDPKFLPSTIPTLGIATKTSSGEPLIVVNIEKIDAKVRTASFVDRVNLKEWFSIGTFDKESLRSHIIAHEIGHIWWEKHSEKSSMLMPIPGKGGAMAKLETNPILNSWADDIWPRYKSGMSGYSRYVDSYREAFSDSFAAFVTGEELHPAIEEWFLENVK